MIKFYKNADIKGSSLLLSFSSVGLTGNFASSLLINNNGFENVGFFFSHYLTPYVGTNPETSTALYNGQVYFNQEKHLVLINFHAGVAHHFRNDFCSELLSIYNQFSFKSILIYGGIGKEFANDEELRSKYVNVYYLTSEANFEGAKLNIKNFENLVNIENKKKPLEEVKYLEKCGIAKHLIKFLLKRNVVFHYIFAFSNELFDPLAGFAVYNKLTALLGLKSSDLEVPKYVDNVNRFLDDIEKNYKIEPAWKLFLEE